jgi:hypothetical protein
METKEFIMTSATKTELWFGRIFLLLTLIHPIGSGNLGRAGLPEYFTTSQRTFDSVMCGGNEFNPYSTRSAATIGVLERNLREFDPTRQFLRTSPDAGSMHSYPDFDPNWYKGFELIPFVAETGIHCLTDARGNREVIDKSEFFELNKWLILLL